MTITLDSVSDINNLYVLAGQREIPPRHDVFDVVVGFVGPRYPDRHCSYSMVHQYCIDFVNHSYGAGETHRCTGYSFYCCFIRQLDMFTPDGLGEFFLIYIVVAANERSNGLVLC